MYRYTHMLVFLLNINLRVTFLVKRICIFVSFKRYWQTVFWRVSNLDSYQQWMRVWIALHVWQYLVFTSLVAGWVNHTGVNHIIICQRHFNLSFRTGDFKWGAQTISDIKAVPLGLGDNLSVHERFGSCVLFTRKGRKFFNHKMEF